MEKNQRKFSSSKRDFTFLENAKNDKEATQLISSYQELTFALTLMISYLPITQEEDLRFSTFPNFSIDFRFHLLISGFLFP